MPHVKNKDNNCRRRQLSTSHQYFMISWIFYVHIKNHFINSLCGRGCKGIYICAMCIHFVIVYVYRFISLLLLIDNDDGWLLCKLSSKSDLILSFILYFYFYFLILTYAMVRFFCLTCKEYLEQKIPKNSNYLL